MQPLQGLFMGLGSLPALSDAETRSISAENPRGERGAGAQAVPGPENPASRLGVGWKVRPCITLQPGETVTLADIEGPGVIQHIWMTAAPETYRDAVLRFTWDDEETSSVETPLGDFFCNGHGLRCNINSLPLAVNPTGGFNCYWPMPFRRRARITIESQHPRPIEGFFYQITYARTEIAPASAYFHAQWRRALTSREHPEYTILEGVRGQGHYVGTYLAWTQMSNGWWGEGEIKFYLDGDDRFPTICGTGTEDYFGGAWCFGGGRDPAQTQTYSTPFLGYPLFRAAPGEVPRHGLYRWHIMDAIRFKRDLRVTIQTLGWISALRKFLPLADDVASVAYWYQMEPHAAFPALPEPFERMSR